MFVYDSLSELKFMLEFNLPKDISDNQEHIKLVVHHIELPEVETPMCPIGCKSIARRIAGEVHCMEYYKNVKDILPFINKWAVSVYCACNKLNNDRNNLFVKAKLYAYKNDGSLFKKFYLLGFHPLFKPINVWVDSMVELVFNFDDMIECKQ